MAAKKEAPISAEEKQVQDIIESVESKQTIEDIKQLTSEFSDIFAKPMWLKPYVVSDRYDCFVKATLRVPGKETSGITENYISMDLFGSPPSYIKSFNFELGYGDGGNKATLVFDDYDSTISDVLMLRLEKYRKQTTPSGNIYLDIEFGYVRPTYYIAKSIDRNLRKKLEFSHIETFRLAKFSSTYSDMKSTYTFELEAQNTIENSDIAYLSPYEILGSHPAVKMKLFEILSGLGDAVQKKAGEEREEIRKQLKKLGNKSKKNEKEIKTLEEKLTKLNKDVETAVRKIDELNKTDKIKQIEGTKELSGQLFKKAFDSSKFKEVNDMLSDFMTDPQIMDIISSLSVYVHESSVHPWDIFKYCFRAMVEQFKQDTRAPVPLILSFLPGLKLNDIKKFKEEEWDSDTYLEIIDAKILDRIFGKAKSTVDTKKYEKYEAAVNIKVSVLSINQTTSWEKLFSELFKYIKITPNYLSDPKSRKEFDDKITAGEKNLSKDKLSDESLRKIIELFPRIDKDIFIVDTYADQNTYEEAAKDAEKNKTQYVQREGTVQRILKAVTGFTQRMGNLDKNQDNETEASQYADKIMKIVNAFIQKNKNRKIMYIIMYEDLEGTRAPFNGGRWGNNVVQAYSYRFMHNDKTEFWQAGLSKMSMTSIPDVINFTISEYDFENVIKSINESNDASISVSVGGKEIKKVEELDVKELSALTEEQRAEKLKDTGMTESEWQLKLKQNKDKAKISYVKSTIKKYDYLKNYRNNDKMNINFSSNQVLVSGDDSFADTARAKKLVENYRAMMAMRASTTKAQLQILGDPNYDWYCLKKFIFMKLYNIDGRLSMFTGVYMIEKITHAFDGGELKTTLDLVKALQTPEQLGQTARVFFSSDVIDSYTSEALSESGKPTAQKPKEDTVEEPIKKSEKPSSQ